MRFLEDAYLYLRTDSNKTQFDRDEYGNILRNIEIEAGGFTTDIFLPGTSGEKQMLDQIRTSTGIGVK